MGKYILAHDLGTSGNKAALYNKQGKLIGSHLSSYKTFYPSLNWAEQNPFDWWEAVCKSTKELIFKIGIKKEEIAVISFSAQMMGGDEFTIILRNIKNKKNAVNIVQKIHKVLSEVMKIGIDEYSIDSSIGGAIYPDHGTDSESLLRKADLTMYEVKKAGKGDFKFFSSNS